MSANVSRQARLRCWPRRGRGVARQPRLHVQVPSALATARDAALHALDMATGAEAWRASLKRRTSATPMTYRTRSGRQFVVVATGQGEDAALVAFALGPSKTSSSGDR